MYTLHGARLRLFLSIVIALTLSWGFTCKTLAQQSPTQNCTWQDPLTGVMAGSTHDNRTSTQTCSVFVVTWVAPTTVSAITIQFEGSDDGASWTAFTGTSTVVRGTNPSSNVNGSMEIVGTSKLAFVRVNATAFTGTGSVTAYIKGVNGASASLGTGAGGGGSGTVNPGTAPDLAYYATSTNAVSPATNCSYVSNGVTCTGPFNSGSGSGVGGAVDLLQGTNPGTTTNAVTLAAPSSVTAYRLLYPGALVFSGLSGFLGWDNTGAGSFLGSQGNGALVQRSTGSTTTNDCVKYDSNGNTVDAGAPCGTTALSFSALTSGTNTTAALLVGSGASLGPTGTGTLTATQVPTAASATTTTNGAIIYDTTSNNLHAGQQGADAKIAQYTVTPGNGNCVNWTVSAGKIDLGDAGSACGSGGSGGGGVVTYSGPTLSILSGTSFCPIGGGGSCSATETNVDIDSSASATVSKLYVQLSQALGVGNSVVITWRDNAVSQTVTCTVSGAVATACNDTTHSFNVAGGDLLDYQLVFSGTIVVTPTITIMSAFGTSNVGVTNVTATAPLTSSGGTTPNISATYQGNGAKVQASTGSTTTNDCVKFDANGNTVDAGAPCSAGGGPSITSGTFASLPATCTHTSTQSDLYYFTDSWWINAVCTATNTFSYWGQYGMGQPAGPSGGWTAVNAGSNLTFSDDGAGSMYLADTNTSGSNNWRIITKVVPSTPYTIDIFWRSTEFQQSAYDTGIYFYDGTKLMGLEQLGLTGTPTPILRVEKITNVTTDGSTVAQLNTSLNFFGPSMGGMCGRLANDGTTLTFAYSFNCHKFTTLFSEAVGTFITPTKYGFGALNAATSGVAEMWVPSVYVH